jgi:radical SAM protein with 4Fe4S-binding SPASM domain
MCPRLAEGHKEGLMPPDRFHRLAPLFPHLGIVVLTGYGEPFLHPQLADFIAVIHGCGAKPRLTTNGTLLSRDKINQVLDAGVENVQFSIDGGTRQTYEKVRVGAKWDRVLANAALFHETCRTREIEVDTGWVFILMQDNWRELPAAVEEAARAGFRTFVAKLIERNALEFEHEQVIHANDGSLLVDKNEFDGVVAEAQAAAKRNGMEFRLHPFLLGFDGACLADPMHSVFVDWMGNVSPCCHLPVRSDMGSHPEHSLGNVDEQDILEIVLGERAQQFWGNWQSRTVPWVCRRCYQVHRLPDRHLYRSIERMPF